MIGYYVHHQGCGHLTRMTSICAHLRNPVTVLSSVALSDQAVGASVLLPRDDTDPPFPDPTAGGALHWAPLGNNGFADRMRVIANWVDNVRPAAMVVDVSVEVSMFARLLGVPVVTMAMPGDRTDPAHQLGYQAAARILAAWPEDLYAPSWLQRHCAKTTYVGGITRFDGRSDASRPSGGPLSVLVLSGAGGSTIDATNVMDCATAYPDIRWSTLGVTGGPWVDDPWPELCAADVVVTAAGQNSVADIAAARRPAIVIAERRPFDEQSATAAALGSAGLAVIQHGWPDLRDWPQLIDRALAIDPASWQRWQTSGAAARAAAVIDEVAA